MELCTKVLDRQRRCVVGTMMLHPEPPSMKDLLSQLLGILRMLGAKSLQLSAVFRVGLRYREHLPKAIPFLGTILAHCQITLMGPTYSISPCGVGRGLVRPASQFDFSLYPILQTPAPSHRLWSLINILHAKLHVSVSFQTIQLVIWGYPEINK